MDWNGWIKNAAIGMLTMTAVQFANHELRRRARRVETSPVERIAEVGLAGLLAAGYSRLVPPEAWGVQSGLQFARMPAVVSIAGALPFRRNENADPSHWMALRVTEIAAWGAATGALMKFFGEKPSLALTQTELRKLRES